MSESDFVVAVEDAGPARKHVKITLPAEKVSSRLGDALGDLAANATIPGFRRGHAPAKLLEKRFGGELRKETRDRLIQEGFQEASETKIWSISRPTTSWELLTKKT